MITKHNVILASAVVETAHTASGLLAKETPGNPLTKLTPCPPPLCEWLTDKVCACCAWWNDLSCCPGSSMWISGRCLCWTRAKPCWAWGRGTCPTFSTIVFQISWRRKDPPQMYVPLHLRCFESSSLSLCSSSLFLLVKHLQVCLDCCWAKKNYNPRKPEHCFKFCCCCCSC